MLSYTYSLTQEQLFDCSKMYRVKTLKPSVIITVIFWAVFGAMFGLSFVDGFKVVRAVAWMLCFLAVFLTLIIVFSKKGVKTQNELYFKSCQVDGIVTYEFQIYETEFVVAQPQKGNVHHYLYESIVKVVDLDGYVALVLTGNQYIPILANETISPLISTLKSYVKQAK